LDFAAIVKAVKPAPFQNPKEASGIVRNIDRMNQYPTFLDKDNIYATATFKVVDARTDARPGNSNLAPSSLQFRYQPATLIGGPASTTTNRHLFLFK
jgi:hypothetical protein